tara:strand:+ start:1245 stop:1832 length:588 start_codon:yes stop_codon:yes gene_type:complete
MARTINLKSIATKVNNSKKFQKELDKKVLSKIDIQKQRFLAEFQAHPVTQEIDGGVSAKNLSGTLGGYGNLFTFIGFTAASNPTSVIKNIIRSISFRNTKTSFRKSQILRNFAIRVPTKTDIYALTPMPWEGGSWAEGVEEGLSGFSYYMYKKFGEGRSGYGLQSDHEIRKAIFTPKSYITELLNNFRKNIRSIK